MYKENNILGIFFVLSFSNVIIADIISIYLVYVFWVSDCRVFNFFLFEYWVLCTKRIIFLEFFSSFLSRMLLLRILYRFIWLKSFEQAIVECLILFLFEYRVLCKMQGEWYSWNFLHPFFLEYYRLKFFWRNEEERVRIEYLIFCSNIILYNVRGFRDFFILSFSNVIIAYIISVYLA